MTEGAARAQLARRVENGSLEAARRRNRCTKKGGGGGGGVVQRAEKEGEAPCVHLVVGKTREKKFFERRCRFRSEALLRQPASQPASHVLPTIPPSSFACLLHFALSRGINRSMEGGGESTSLLFCTDGT